MELGVPLGRSDHVRTDIEYDVLVIYEQYLVKDDAYTLPHLLLE